MRYVTLYSLNYRYFIQDVTKKSTYMTIHFRILKIKIKKKKTMKTIEKSEFFL